jgi:Flp pilus assembly protein protease CpaA
VFVETHPASLGLVLLLTAVAAAHDLKRGLIPNRLLLGSAGLMLVSHVALAWGIAGKPLLSVLLTSLAGAAVCAIVPLTLYVSRGLGGGDLKLLTLTGAALGPALGLEIEAYAFALGSLYAFAYLAYRGTLLRTVARSLVLLVPALPSLRARPSATPDPELSFRFGPAIFAGALLTTIRYWVLT